MDLRDAALVDAQHIADFLHRQLFRVVESYDALVAFWQGVKCGAKQIAQFFAGTDGIGMVVGAGGKIGSREIFAFVGPCGSGYEANVAEIDHHLAPTVNIHTHFLGNLLLGGISVELGCQLAGDCLYLFVTAAKVS